MTFDKDALNARMNELNELLAAGEHTLDDDTLMFLTNEKETLQQLIAFADANYEELYDVPQADVMTLGESLAAVDAEAMVSGEQAMDDAKVLTARQRDCIDAINILSSKQEELKQDLETQGKLMIAEHPIRYAIESLKSAIADISHAKESLYSGGIEYKNYKKQACDAAFAMGNSAYQGIVAPIRTATADTIENIARSAAAQWRDICDKFHKIKEAVCKKVKEFVFKADVFFERHTKGVNTKVFYSKALRPSFINPEYVAAVKAEAWKDRGGISPLDSAVDNAITKANEMKAATEDALNGVVLKAVELRVSVHNAVIDFRVNCLMNSAKLATRVATNIELKSIRYLKAAKTLGEAEAQIKSEIDKLLEVQTCEANEYTPNPAIQAQIGALRELFPNDTTTKLLIASKEKLLADEKKAWDKQEARIAKVDAKLKDTLVHKETKELNRIEKLYDKASARFDMLVKVFHKFETIAAHQMKAAVSIGSNSKWKVVTADGSASIDKEHGTDASYHVTPHKPVNGAYTETKEETSHVAPSTISPTNADVIERD